MRYTDEAVVNAIEDVIRSIQSVDEKEDRTVVSATAVKRLAEVLGFVRDINDKCRDMKRLARLAVETQDAANPRPLSTLLSNIIHTEMANGGNPAYENSAAARLVLHQMLHLLDRTSLPRYSDAMSLSAYEDDIRACEAIAQGPG